MRWFRFLLPSLFFTVTNAQFGEIASLATSLLGGALGNGAGLGALAGAGAAGAGAAGQAGGALAQIGQLYQLAQGALQLTGTGVGVLNQASEGNWFPAVLEQTAKNSQALMKGGGGVNLGALGPAPGKSGAGAIGPEFGTSFPAPDIDDYDENAEIPGVTAEKKTPKAPDGLVDIEEGDYELETTKVAAITTISPTTEAFSVFPDEEEETTTEPTTPPPRQIRIQLPDKNGKTAPEEELDYEDLINKKSTGGESNALPSIDAESQEELKKNVIATHGTKTQPIVPKLDKLVEVLQKSKLSKEEIDEIVAQVEGNKHIEKPAKYDFNAAVQNIPDKKNQIRQKITDASRIINSNFDNQRKEQSIVIQKQVDHLKVVPDLTESTIAPKRLTTAIAPKTPTTTASAITTTSPKHVQQVRSVPPAAPVVAPLQPTPTQAPQVQTQPYNYLYPQQNFQQPQQIYYTQAPYYGQQTQNYWGQQNQYAPQYGLYQQQQQQQKYAQQQNQYGYYPPTAQPYQQPQPQQQQQYFPQYAQQAQQAQQGQQGQQTHYSTNIPQQVPVTRQQVPQPSAPVQQRPAVQQVSQQAGYQVRSSPQPQKPQYVQPTENTNQVVHYYHDGHQIVQQIIPKQIASTGSLPLNGPFRPQAAGNTDAGEYQRRQRALQQAYQQPRTRGTVQANKPKIYESTVTATGHRQAHAIRTYEATKPGAQTVQPAAATRSSGRVSSAKKRISGHVLPGPTIDHRNILEKRTTAKPRYVRVP